MDPNVTLQDIRQAISDLRGTNHELDYDIDAIEQLMGAVDELDAWLSKGGFKPEAWS